MLVKPLRKTCQAESPDSTFKCNAHRSRWWQKYWRQTDMEAKMNATSMNIATLNRSPINSVALSKMDVKPQGVNTNFRDAAGRYIRTREGLIFKARK